MKSSRIIGLMVLLLMFSWTAPAFGAAASGPLMADYTAYPPFITQSAVPPLVMLVGGKDHKLFQKAYSDYMDLDGDGTWDITYGHDIVYYGYFDSYKCYSYSSVRGRFEPVFVWDPNNPTHVADADYMYCDTAATGLGSNAWSGNFLNWASMTRMDVLRKAMYGGMRYVDDNTATVLERASIPDDGHAFVKTYGEAYLGRLTPYGAYLATYGGISICNVTKTSGGPPLLRVARGDNWTFWSALESPQCGYDEEDGVHGYRPNIAAGDRIADLTVRVLVAVDDTSLHGQERLRYYANQDNYKPTGLLQEYGEDSQMYFGHISGSYNKSKSGGVLRGKIDDIGDDNSGQINRSTGNFTGRTGVITALDELKIRDYDYTTKDYGASCTEGAGLPGVQDGITFTDGQCRDFGNPLAEMYYETLRYFSGRSGAKPAYATNDPALQTTWNSQVDPYSYNPWCAKAFALILSDVTPSYDSDQLPGGYAGFGSISDDINIDDLGTTALDVETLADIVGDNENLSGQYFVEQVGGTDTNDCTPKALTSGDNLGDIRGICPEGAGTEGSYYLPGLSLYGRRNDMHATAQGDQVVTTFALAMSSGSPAIEVTVNGYDAEIIPYCFNYRDNNPCTLVDFKVDVKTATSGQFRVTYDDALRGSDFDRDAAGYIVYQIIDSDGNGQTDKLYVDSYLLWQSSDADMRIGFVLNGGPEEAHDETWIDAGVAGWDTETAFYDGANRDISSSSLWLLTSDECSCDQVNAGQTECGGDTFGGVVCPWRWLTFDFSDPSDLTASARNLENPLWYAAKYGAFEDFDGDNIPDLQGEWDRDGDGVPNGYWFIDNPLEMELRLREAFNEILRRTSSGTAVSVLATTGEGEGAITQAYFHPEYVDGANVRRWLGYINSFFVDPYGNIREDTDNDDVLEYRDLADCMADQDLIVNLYYDETDKQTRVKYWKDANCDGEFDVDTTGNSVNDAYTDTGITTPLTDVNPLWSGGHKLWDRDADTRKIFTSLNGYDGSGLATNVTKGNFQEGNATSGELQNRLRLSGNTGASRQAEAENIIKWIRGHGVIAGEDLAGVTDAGHSSGYRARSIELGGQTKVWKLGDIINSTPMVVSRPAENYDLLYDSSTYNQFRKKYNGRRNVVYVGANDGMVHAFNGGYYDQDDHAFCKGFNMAGNCDPTATPELGDELWAYIPTGLLPHLKWLTDPNYTHVYYVDLKPKITDAQIFVEEADCGSGTSIYDPDCIHPGGWGTILIGGMRYGGKEINYTVGSGGSAINYEFNPEYFALDITVPTAPRLLWTFTDQLCNTSTGMCSDGITACTTHAACPSEGLGLSMSQPAVARTCDSSRHNCKWFAIFGSGPTDYDQLSNITGLQQGNVFVLDMSSGAQVVGDTNGRVTSWTGNSNFWKFTSSNLSAFMSDPVTVDVDLDFDVDVTYIGENCTDTNSDVCSIAGTGAKNAYMRRITTNKGLSNDPGSADWVMSSFVDVEVVSGASEDARRITSPPSAAMDERTNLWTFFGTGQFLGTNDRANPGTGAFFGVKDKCWDGSCTDVYSNLNDVSNVLVCLGGDATCAGGTSLNNLIVNDFCNGGTGLCGDGTTPCTSDADCVMGWSIYFSTMTAETTDFAGDVLSHTGEMVISKPLVVGGLVIWPTFIPSADDCDTDGESNVYAVFYKTGTAFSKFIFQEQKDLGGNNTTVVGRVKSLGKGMPSSVSAQITAKGRAKGYAQSSTGAIIEIESNTPLSLKSNVIGWRGEEVP